MRLVSAEDVVGLLVAVLLQQGDEEAAAWVQGPGATGVAEQARAIVDVLRRKGSGGRSSESAHDPELPPEADPFEGLRGAGVLMSALVERAASIVYGRYLANLPAGVRGLAAALYGTKMVDILLSVEGFGLSGIGGWRGQRGFEAKVEQMMGATDPARTLGRAPPTLRTEDQAADWLRMELATMGLSDLSVSVSVERPRYSSNYWSATLELRGERIHGGADTKSGALADVVNKPAVWAVCANEIVRRAGFVFPTRDEWNAQRSTAGSVALGVREDQERAKVSRETKARQAYEAAWTATAERYIALSKEARRIVTAIRARAAAKGREDSANLHDAKAVTEGTGWTVTSGAKGSGYGGTRYALRFDGDDRFYWDNYGRGGAGKIETYWADQTVEDIRKARANRQMIHGFREPPEPRGYWTKGDADLEEYLADLRRFESGRVYRENGRGAAKSWEPPKTDKADDVLRSHTALWKADRFVAVAAIAMGIADVTGETYTPASTPPAGKVQSWQARRIAADPEGWAQVLRAAARRLDDARAQAARWRGEVSTRDAAAAQDAAYEASAAEELPTRRDHVWMYHGTSDKFLPAILRDGLTPGHAPSNFGSKGQPNKVQRYVYLTTDAAAAADYARRAAARHGVTGWYSGCACRRRACPPIETMSI